MSRDISSDTRKLAKRGPHSAETRYIEEFLAVLEAGLHPRIVGAQVSTLPDLANVRPRVSIDRTPQ